MHKRYLDNHNVIQRLEKMNMRYIVRLERKANRIQLKRRPKVYQVYKLMEKQSYRCYWCCTFIKNTLFELEHIQPKCRGGSDNLYNLRLSCLNCNDKKGINMPMDFALYLLGAPYKRTPRTASTSRRRPNRKNR